MRNEKDTYRLLNGVEIPCIGFGTWQTPDGDVCVNSVKCAIQAGYRHIDTAQAYGNEEGVGEGIRQGGVAREELFITTKLWNNNHSYDLTMRTFEESLRKLGLDYVDLFLIHWPNPAMYRSRWEQGMILEAYSPLGNGKIFEVPEMKALADKYHKSVAQICIRWGLQQGYLPLPKSVTPSRIEDNLKVFDFELTEEDVRLIANLKGCVGLSGDPDKMPF